MRVDSIRVAVAYLDGEPAAWHRAVVDAVSRVEGVELVEPSTDAFDLLIDLDGRSMPIDCALGVWRYGFGDGAAVADGAAGTWARLYRLTADPERAVVLRDGWYRARTRHGWGTWSVGERVAPWCASVLRQLRLGGAALLQQSSVPTAGCRGTAPRDEHPPIGRLGVDVVDTVRGWLTRQRWTIGVVPAGIEDIIRRGSLPDPTWIEPQPPDRFFADPFILEVEGDRVRLLVEEYHYPSRIKQLVALDVTRSGQIVGTEAPPGLPPHASYPFLLARGDQDRVVCIPETSGAEQAAAYMMSEDGCWTRAHTLLDRFRAVDSTLLEHDGWWWLFCTKQGDEDQTELHLFIAPDWTGPWTPHPLNPVKSDTRSSRPAGACFRIDGQIYRPAQNCARRYGAGITINRIVELTPHSFREEAVLSLRPQSDTWPHGLHTINSIGGITVVDGLRVERRWGPAALHPGV
jgi:hypothetical protein